MKTKHVLISLCFCSSLLSSTLGFSQATYKLINDRAIVAQHKRMVFEKWGDWYPEPKFWFGLQTNFAAHVVWGYDLYGVPSFVTPKRNKQYKKGSDIRPLKANGLQNQRLLDREAQLFETKEIKKASEDLLKKSKRDAVHWSHLLVSTDPLWLLYYKEMLKPLKNMPENPVSYSEWELPSQEAYDKLNAIGVIRYLKEKLELMKHNYEVSRTVPMPRGKRILLYHKTLMDWRKFEKYKESCINDVNSFLKIKEKESVGHSQVNNFQYQDDTTIVKKVLAKWNYLNK